MMTRIQKCGNSQGLRLSKRVLNLAGIAMGDEVEIIVGDRQIVITKRARLKFELAQLVKRIPTGYKTKAAYFGLRKGKEYW